VVTSPAFTERGLIPPRHTCDGADVSPALAWADPPAGTRSLAIVCDDPDAPMGAWVHWVLYNLPASARGLPEALPAGAVLPDGSRQGLNDFRKSGYGGPCPPPGRPHRYSFRLYALDTRLELAGAPTRRELEQAMRGHVLAEGRLVGMYGR
jgi:Raf kinase inhibitor-like YbhB/YbcL family protein